MHREQSPGRVVVGAMCALIAVRVLADDSGSPVPARQDGWRYLRADLAGSNAYPFGSSVATANDLALVWSVAATSAGSASGSVLTGDVNGDGLLEVVQVAGNQLRIFGSGGAPLRAVTLPAAECAVSMLADISGDGVADIGIGCTGSLMQAFFYDGNGVRLKTVSKTGGYDASMYPVGFLANGNVIVDQRVGFGWPNGYRGFSVFDRKSGAELWLFRVGPSHAISSIGDLDGDGVLELAGSAYSSHNGCSGNGSNGNGATTTDSDMWTIIVDQNGKERLAKIYSAPSAGLAVHHFTDLDHNGQAEILAAESHDATFYPGISQIHLMSAAGAELATFDGPANASWSYAWGDLNGDGRDEVVASAGGTVYVLSATLAPLARANVPGQVQLIADLNGDHVPEIVLLDDGGGLRVLGADLSVLQTVQVGGGGGRVIASDLDRDGRLELICASNGLWVLENRGGEVPDVTVLDGNIPVSDGQATPVSFGTADQGGPPPAKTFTVRNDGTAPLTLGAATVPAGFSVVDDLDASLPPGASDTFTVRLDTATAGTRGGEISFATNDPDENPFNFPVSGTVVCTAPTITTQPEGSTVSAGGSATLSVVATGSPPLAYQWYRGASGDVSQPIAGATAPAFSSGPLAVAGSLSFWVRVSNACGRADSAAAVVTVTGGSPCSLQCSASADVTSGEAPLPVQFTGSVTTSGVCASSPAWDWDFGDALPHSTQQSPSHSYGTAGTFAWRSVVAADGATCSRSGSITVLAVGVVPPITAAGDRVYVCSTVAHSAGVGGTSWLSDVVIHNPGGVDAIAYVYFLKRNQSNTASRGRRVVVPACQSVKLTDVVEDTFGESNASGALLVGSGQDLVVTSRTYNNASGGTYGQYIAGSPLAEAIGGNEEVRLIQLTKNSSFRTNIGFASAAAASLSVAADFFTAQGVKLGTTKKYTLAPYGQVQDTDVISKLTSASVDDAYAIVKSATAGARFFVYASVIDYRTGDPIEVVPVGRAGSGNAEGLVYVSAAANLTGAGGTNWRTDLEVHNPQATRADYSIALLRRDQGNPTPQTVTASLDPGKSVRYGGVLQSLFSFAGAAALRLSAAGARLMVTSRTYNDLATGTYGQFIPGLPPSQAAPFGQSARLVQLSQSSASTGFRSNLGFTNTSVLPISVETMLFKGDGTYLGIKSYALAPFEFRQVDKIFRAVTTAEVPDGYASVSTSTPGGSVLAYASVIDGRSGDPILIPGALLSTAGRRRPVVLDNRSSALLLDQRAESLGVDALPDGTFTATVTGTGDLGRSDLPTHVVCLYRDGEGELRASALRFGDSVDNIGGGYPFRCAVVDWIGKDDNTGGAQVTLVSPTGTVTLQLDAKSNCILVDSLSESAVETFPAPYYAVAATGNLGSSQDVPHLLAMFRDGVTGDLTVRVVRDGDTIGPVLATSRVVAVVLDWLNRADNTGSTELDPVSAPGLAPTAAGRHAK